MSDDDLLSQLRIDPGQREGGTRRPWRWLAILLLVVAVGVGAVFFALQGRALPVRLATVEPPPRADNQVPVLDATGYVTARLEATVSSKITGKLSEVLIEEGDRVKAGQVLARLEGADEKAQLRLAQAQLGAAQSQLGELQTQLDQARRDLSRQQSLNTKGLSSEQTLEDARTRMLTLQAQMAAQRKQILVAQAQVNVAQVNVDNTIIRAPFSGVIIAKAAQPGEIVSPISAGGGYTRTGIGTIVDMDSLEIEVDVNESYINRVKPGQPVTAVLDAYPDWKIPAQVIAIIPAADRSKATVRVRIGFQVKDPRIVPDMGVRVSFFEDKADQKARPIKGVLVPSSAVVERDGRNVVFRVQDGVAHRLPVTAGQSYGDLRLISQGLAVGDRIVRDPPVQLGDGTRVKAETATP
ncbi:efflux RND transporter periplasmic adaptor subunit [Mangrovitalea sediminis]|uniref:efflux RND transporter periplasmic adaptor subunit n=1 Tax=Mangrovitalea sediminis TaxID=1982043 RepID=UPI000BE58A47|nr:efflux RND transporter periplasmic adaptor subunit [Mangrovitalea sediminis]